MSAGFDILLRILIASTGYSEEDSNSSSDDSSPAALRAVERLKQMAKDFDQLRDSVLPLGVELSTRTWTMEKVLADVRMAEEGSPASVVKYDLSDEQKATFLNGILDLCNYVCAAKSDEVIIDIANTSETITSSSNTTTPTPTTTTTTTTSISISATSSPAPASATVTTPTSSSLPSLPTNDDFMEGIERIRVASKLRDLHGLFEGQLLFEPTRDVQKKMTEMMSQRADDVSRDKDELLDMQAQFRKTKELAMQELNQAKNQVQEQEKASEAFGPRMANLFEQRDAKHDEQISLLQLSDAAADYMLTQQQSMLKGRECFCLVVDRRQVRRNCYCCISIAIIVAIVYSMSMVPGI